MPRKAIIVIVLIAIAVTAAVVARRAGNGPAQLAVSGTVEVTSVELSFKVGGRLARRLVDEGMTVSAGQRVALLEDDELKLEHAARAADEQASRAALADLEAGSRTEEIRQAEAALNRAKAEAVRLSSEAERAETLYKREIIPLRELEAARAGRDVSAAALREADERLALAKAGPRPDAVRQARSKVDALSASRLLSETRLSQAVLTSPLPGLVLAKHVEAGEMLSPGSPVVTVGRLEDAWIRAYIPEDQLGRVRVGQTARVTVDSWPGRVFEGRVSFISPEAEFTPKSVQTQKERVKLVYRIKITLPNPKGELKPGMPADAVLVSP